MASKPLARNAEGKFDKYAWPGGYPLYYCSTYTVLCADCASKDTDQDDPIVEAQINWENPSLYCEGCGERIESAYADKG